MSLELLFKTSFFFCSYKEKNNFLNDFKNTSSTSLVYLQNNFFQKPTLKSIQIKIV